MSEHMAVPGTCTHTANHATGERCGSTEIAGFALHVTSRNVADALTGGHPELYLQPHCAEHLKQTDESNERLREHGPSPILAQAGFVGSAVGTVWIIEPSTADEMRPCCGGPATGCVQDGETEGDGATTVWIDHGPTCPAREDTR